MSVFQSARMKGEDALEKVKEIFERIIPKEMQPRDEKGRFVKNTDPATGTVVAAPEGEPSAVVPA